VYHLGETRKYLKALNDRRYDCQKSEAFSLLVLPYSPSFWLVTSGNNAYNVVNTSFHLLLLVYLTFTLSVKAH